MIIVKCTKKIKEQKNIDRRITQIFDLFSNFSCDDGYFGSPTKIGSNCTKCPCNGAPCDPFTGRCITCQYV